MRQGNMGHGFGCGGNKRGNMAGQCRFGAPASGGAQGGRQDMGQGPGFGQEQGIKRRGVFSVTPAAPEDQTDAAGQPEAPETMSAAGNQTGPQGDLGPAIGNRPAPGGFGQGGRCRMQRRRDGSCRGLGR